MSTLKSIASASRNLHQQYNETGVTQTNKMFLFYSFVQTITIKPKLGPTYTNRLRQFAANLSKLFHEKNMATDCKLLGKDGFGFDDELVGLC